MLTVSNPQVAMNVFTTITTTGNNSDDEENDGNDNDDEEQGDSMRTKANKKVVYDLKLIGYNARLLDPLRIHSQQQQQEQQGSNMCQFDFESAQLLNNDMWVHIANFLDLNFNLRVLPRISKRFFREIYQQNDILWQNLLTNCFTVLPIQRAKLFNDKQEENNDNNTSNHIVAAPTCKVFQYFYRAFANPAANDEILKTSNRAKTVINFTWILDQSYITQHGINNLEPLRQNLHMFLMQVFYNAYMCCNVTVRLADNNNTNNSNNSNDSKSQYKVHCCAVMYQRAFQTMNRDMLDGDMQGMQFLSTVFENASNTARIMNLLGMIHDKYDCPIIEIIGTLNSKIFAGLIGFTVDKPLFSNLLVIEKFKDICKWLPGLESVQILTEDTAMYIAFTNESESGATALYPMFQIFTQMIPSFFLSEGEELDEFEKKRNEQEVARNLLWHEKQMEKIRAGCDLEDLKLGRAEFDAAEDKKEEESMQATKATINDENVFVTPIDDDPFGDDHK